MYKVFFNDSFLIISDKIEILKQENLLLDPIYDFKQIENWLIEAENPDNVLNKIYINPNIDESWIQFNRLFRNIQAAGGIVKNKANKILLIYRRGKWDLPKGKFKEAETPENAAIREVQEETGLSKVEIENELTTSYHIYRFKNELMLKETFWYSMINKGSDFLKPEHEEDIEKAVWFSKQEINSVINNMFGTIKDVISLL